ncbi:MAG TPA: hypothetical protein VJA25_08115 [Dehalococcoidia bacterium]|nr:hypothetical protein [Dehalococcoidia bacterium]
MKKVKSVIARVGYFLLLAMLMLVIGLIGGAIMWGLNSLFGGDASIGSFSGAHALDDIPALWHRVFGG